MVSFSDNSENPMSALAQMNQQMKKWMDEKPSFADFGKEIRMYQDDIIIGFFVANGDEGDKYIKIYRSHVLDAISKNGKPYTEHRYCPVQSGDGDECVLCASGHEDIKERMSMYFYVLNFLHKRLPAEKSFPSISYNGEAYFNEVINDFRVWHTSAWRESPWNDINMNGQMYKGLHNFRAILKCVGPADFSRRFKLYADPEPNKFPEDLYERAKTELEPLPVLLSKDLNTPITLRPKEDGNTTPQAEMLSAFVPGSNTVNMGTGSPIDIPPFDVPDPGADGSNRPMRSLF